MEKTKKSDFVEIKFTGYANEQIFDSNVEEDLKKIDSEAKPHKIIVAIGEKMVVPGLDNALEDKEIGKEYTINVNFREGFGERKKELIKTIPLAAFIQKKVNPSPGMVLALDNSIVKIIAVSGARVTADFNNLLAGKDLKYKFTIVRKVEEEKEKAESFFENFLHFVPEMDFGEEITIKGPKILEEVVKYYREKFKELVGKNLNFKEKEEKHDHEHSHHDHEHNHVHAH